MAQDAGAKPKLSGKLMQLKARARRSLLHARSVACCVQCGLSPRPLRSSCSARWRKTAQRSPRRCRCAPAALSREQLLRSKAAAMARRLCCGADAPAPRRAGCARHIRALGRSCGGRNAALVRRSAAAACTALRFARASTLTARAPRAAAPSSWRTTISRASCWAACLSGASLPCRVHACMWLEARASALKRASPRAETTTRRRKSCTRRRRLAPPRRRVRQRCVASHCVLSLHCHRRRRNARRERERRADGAAPGRRARRQARGGRCGRGCPRP